MSADISIADNVTKEMYKAAIGGVADFDVRNADSSYGDSEDFFVPSMRGGAPSAKASKPPEHEVGLDSSIIKY
jgi:hypothetical protein